jgi:hypothetical protein
MKKTPFLAIICRKTGFCWTGLALFDSNYFSRHDHETPELGAISYQFLRYESPEMTMFFLEKELYLLQEKTWFVDGTFTICKDISDRQIYIISVLFESDDKKRVFSYPIIFVFCKSKGAELYKNMFRVINRKFLESEKSGLNPLNINSDCEQSLIISVKTVYPNANINLCQVHIQRAWERKLFEKVGRTNFNRNKILKRNLTILNGSFKSDFRSEFEYKVLFSNLRVWWFLHFLQLLCHKNAQNAR